MKKSENNSDRKSKCAAGALEPFLCITWFNFALLQNETEVPNELPFLFCAAPQVWKPMSIL
ncbi:hypothetical protein ACE6ED_22240 [Paenibacillus sp. CN-4]|uniref:hypothetical protein n=1 Tax=Paenibacillus nanchangensis TaxID=3348343 RepID=UPI003979CA80